MRLLLISILLSFLLTNCPTEDTQVVEMTASVSPEEAGEVNPPNGTYLAGREITVKTDPVDDRWEFTGWSGDTTASDDSLTFVITRDMNIVANYEIPSDEKPLLTTTAQPTEGGTINPDGGSYEFGTLVDVEAVPAEGWEFTEWGGDTSSTSNPIGLTMDKDYNLTAHFVEKPKLTTNTEPAEGGTVEPESGTFDFGESVEVVAVPAEGWEFVEWSGDTSSASNPLILTMGKSYDLTANFEELANAFTNQITVTDGTNDMDLFFGMDPNATDGFDDGLDRDLPPPPPEGSFYAQFNIPDYALAEDYRPVSSEEAIWTLEFAPDEGQTISLNWDFSNTNHVGALMLTDDPDDPSFEIDMKSETSYEVSDESLDILYIISN